MMRSRAGCPSISTSLAILIPLSALVWGCQGKTGDSGGGPGDEPTGEVESVAFPVTATLLVDGAFDRSEGITFNGEGRLFVAANAAVWSVTTDGQVSQLTDLYTNLGMAAIGERDFLVADFGPTNGFSHGPNRDGIVWRVTPEGEKTEAALGMGDPNAIVVRADGSYLVSDDATNEIFKVGPDGSVSLFSTEIDHPNGLALSLDGRTLYVAQIFSSISPTVPDDRIWALPLDDLGDPSGPPVVFGRTEEGGAPDGLVLDALGRLYVAVNGEGRVYRFDPASGERILITEGVPHIASLVFGKGAFDPHTLFGTSTRPGGGKVWMIPVGVGGAPLFR